MSDTQILNNALDIEKGYSDIDSAMRYVTRETNSVVCGIRYEVCDIFYCFRQNGKHNNQLVLHNIL